MFTKLFRHCSPFPHLNPCSLKVIGIPSQNHITWQHDALTKFVNYSLGRWSIGLFFTYYRAPFDQSQRKDDDDVSIPDRTSRKRQIYKLVGTLAWIISNLYPVQCNALQYSINRNILHVGAFQLEDKYLRPNIIFHKM